MKTLLAITITVLFCCNLSAQNDNELTGSSKGSNIPGSISNSYLSTNVDYGTGLISQVIPLASISSYTLSSQVSLVYGSGSGVKVNDYASYVGLGWNINAGGSI